MTWLLLMVAFWLNIAAMMTGNLVFCAIAFFVIMAAGRESGKKDESS